MSDISHDAQLAREGARQATGQFGEQPQDPSTAAFPGTDLEWNLVEADERYPDVKEHVAYVESYAGPIRVSITPGDNDSFDAPGFEYGVRVGGESSRHRYSGHAATLEEAKRAAVEDIEYVTSGRAELDATAEDESDAREDERVRSYVKELNAGEHAQLSRLPIKDLVRISAKLDEGPGDAYRATGPRERSEIVRQIGSGNVLGISGGRVYPLPDGIELPVSNGYSVQVRLHASDTYTVQRIFRRAGKESVKGERDRVYAEEVAEVAYRAGMFQSYDEF